MDDFTETGRKLIPLGDMPPVDMAQVEGEATVGENLEVDDDDDAAAAMQDAVMKDVNEDDDEVDPLDAYMTGVNVEVQKVNAEDRQKFGLGRMEMDGAEEGEEQEVTAAPDELDTTNLRPEDILA